jgi:predicted AAA+ superfamily ATPase
LLGVGVGHSLADQPWVGASWEGFVIEQLLAVLAQRDLRADAYFFRTSDQHEVDLVLEGGGRRCAIEVKLTASPGPDDMRRLSRTADLFDADTRVLISRTRHSVANAREVSCSLPWLLRHFERTLGLG